jgi:hypothetical protein
MTMTLTGLPARKRDNAAAAIQPAVPPPTITIVSIAMSRYPQIHFNCIFLPSSTDDANVNVHFFL